MANVNLPAPLLLAGGALCLLGGYMIGVVAGPQTTDQTVAVVESYDPDTRELCLTGDSLDDDDRATDGVLCGEWRRTPGATRPVEGDDFRFVAIERADDADGGDTAVYIHGAVMEDGS